MRRSGRAIIWSRTDRPARMLVEWSTSEKFTDAVPSAARPRSKRPISLPRSTSATCRRARRIFYRVQWQDLRDLKILSEPAAGSLVMPPAPDAPRDVTVVFTGDVCGQGWGIDPARGGLKMFETMRRAEPDLFIHLGDTIYADSPIAVGGAARRRHACGGTS